MRDSTLYRHKGRWKLLLLVIAAGIVLATVAYTDYLSRSIKKEERRKVEQLADAYQFVLDPNLPGDFPFVLDFIAADHAIPLMVVDEENEVVQFRNLDTTRVDDPAYIERQLERMKNYAEPVVIEVVEGTNQYLYYHHSKIYEQVRWFPVLQLSIIGAFLLAAYVMFSTARRAEQNRVWVGMAKETAHQLGTPIQSLVSWVEYLRDVGPDADLGDTLSEMSRDLRRLELIAERFSKVGSSPDLQETDILPVLDGAVAYIKRRASRKVEFEVNSPEESLMVKLNIPLFEWVIENLLKNALDAMQGSGKIKIDMVARGQEIVLDITDTGKGIPKSKFQAVFDPGYSTKKRGWGLGLTLVKRIVENYHNGKIFVRNSVPGQGTTFRITLPLA